MPDYHVVKSGHGSTPWQLKRNRRAVSNHRTQQTAINASRREANVGDNVYVHGVDGKIRNEFTKGGRDG